MPVAHVFEERPADPARRRAALAAAVERLAARAHEVRTLAPRPGARAQADLVSSSAAGQTHDSGVDAVALPYRFVPSPPSPGPVDAAARSAGRDPIAVLEPLAALLPGGVRRGEALSLAGAPHPVGATAPAAVTVDYLALALLAGALRDGLWCAAVGANALGGAALAGLLGAQAVRAGALQRLLVVPEPGERWAEVSAVLADGVDLVLLSPPEAVSPQVARRVDARLRQGAAAGERHRAALLVLGPWPSARAVLRVTRLGWVGLGTGTGHLRGGEAIVTAQDRARRQRTARLWLPAAEGALAPWPASAQAPTQGRRLTAVA